MEIVVVLKKEKGEGREAEEREGGGRRGDL